MALGATREEALAGIRAQGGDDNHDLGWELDGCEIYPENWETVLLFLRLQTQWRVGPMGGLLGFDYPGLESAMRLMRIEGRAEMFARLAIMEHAALEAAHADQ